MAQASLTVGIVVERRESHHPWQSHTWKPIAILPGAPAGEGLRKLAEGDGWVQYFAGNLEIELFRKDTEGYKSNLSSIDPRVYVVFRRYEGADEPLPFLATVSPYEAESYDQGGEDLVEAVAMSPEIADWVAAFVEAHHKDEPFYKRRRKRHDVEGSAKSGGRGSDSL